MGDADHDMIKTLQEQEKFEMRIPQIEVMIKKTFFDKMNKEQHNDAYKYYTKLMEDEREEAIKRIEKKYFEIRNKHWEEIWK